ncbi:hypothetical protein CDD83_7676 [Cordyceps sp. RAO-2017]|nr:hypothetical protein CDD83_7676 [Cordyceps sp. RAO-2017]
MDLTFEKLLSDPRYNQLMFYDVTALSPDQKLAVAECMSEVLSVFLSKVGYQYVSPSPDDRLRDDLLQWGQKHVAPISACGEEALRELFGLSTSITEHCYPLAEHESRLMIATASVAMISLDDQIIKPESRKHYNRFYYDMFLGSADTDGWSKLYSTVIRDFVHYFGAKDPRFGSLAGSGFASFAEATYTEEQLRSQLPPHLSHASPACGLAKNNLCPTNFAYYNRAITGVTTPYIVTMFKPCRDTEVPFEYWITSVANLIAWICLINDIFSFSKEVVAGENFNYISLQTLSKRQVGVPSSSGADSLWTFKDTICETLDILYKCTQELDGAFIEFSKYVEKSRRV